MKTAPWTDYIGQQIHELDLIEHPSGERGIVFYKDRGNPMDSWLVCYLSKTADSSFSRLCLQIRGKGQAVVVKRLKIGEAFNPFHSYMENN